MPRATCTVEIEVNGQQQRAEVEPRLLLVHYLRDSLGLTGTHVGCDTSQCGACTVLVDGDAVKSCTLFAVQASGAAVTTIEGLAPAGVIARHAGPDTHDSLHPLQVGFWEEHGLQCGFCTPGMIMASCDLLKRKLNPTEHEIREGLEGNICRCTGYQHIVKSVQTAARRLRAHDSEAPAATSSATSAVGGTR